MGREEQGAQGANRVEVDWDNLSPALSREVFWAKWILGLLGPLSIGVLFTLGLAFSSTALLILAGVQFSAFSVVTIQWSRSLRRRAEAEAALSGASIQPFSREAWRSRRTWAMVAWTILNAALLILVVARG